MHTKDLQAADQLKTNFLALASHELRTPLGIIIGYASFLQDESPGELSDHARQVLNTAMQMRSLIDSMTNLNMLRSREMVMHRLVVPIQQVLRSAFAEVKALAEARSQQVMFEMPERVIQVMAGHAERPVVAAGLPGVLGEALLQPLLTSRASLEQRPYTHGVRAKFLGTRLGLRQRPEAHAHVRGRRPSFGGLRRVRKFVQDAKGMCKKKRVEDYKG